MFTIEFGQLVALALFDAHSLSRLFISVGIFATLGPGLVGVFAVLAPAAGGHIVAFCPTFALGAFTLTAAFEAQTLAESSPSSSSPHVPPKLVDGV